MVAAKNNNNGGGKQGKGGNQNQNVGKMVVKVTIMEVLVVQQYPQKGGGEGRWMEV